MLKKKVIVPTKIVLSAHEEKRVADVFMLFVAVDRRGDGQKNRSQKKKVRTSKNKRGVYDKRTPLVDQVILLRPGKTIGFYISQSLFFL